MKFETRFQSARADRPALVNLANAALGWLSRWVRFDAQAMVRAAAKAAREAEDHLLFRGELEALCDATEAADAPFPVP